jgi:hypothetical protein
MISYTRKASIALDILTPRQRNKILAAIADLDRPLEEIAGSSHITKLNTPGNLYITRAGASLRIIFEVTDEGVRILDVVHREGLEEFHRSLAIGAHA